MLLIHIIIQFTPYSFNSIIWVMLQMILSTTNQVKKILILQMMQVMYSSHLLQIDKRGRGNKESFNLLKLMLQII